MYVNYGDYHFFEHGRLVDSEHSDTEIRILYCEPYPDETDLYQFAELTVDITDDWMNQEEVCSFAGLDLKNPDPISYALAAVDYYGPENFGAESSMLYCDWQHMNRQSIMDILKYRLIASDNLSLDAPN